MYTLQDRRGSTLCLRPENTAGLARAFGSSTLAQAHELPQRFYYNGPMFRYHPPEPPWLIQLLRYAAPQSMVDEQL